MFDFVNAFDFTAVDRQLIALRDYEKMSEALAELQTILGEDTQMTGRLYFDRYWWTTRQAGCHLFRIGELEYEMKHIDDSIVIGIHIPSDADFSPSKVDDSITNARRFFSKYYPELSDTEYRCHSWLLDHHLRGMLNNDSNILYFQNLFEIIDEGEVGSDFRIF